VHRRETVVIILLLIIVGVCALAAVVATLGRSSRPDEVERFHRARDLTTEWSRRYTGQPGVPVQHNHEEREREREHADH
jgi:flagellar basal body-associated protein FliL